MLTVRCRDHILPDDFLLFFDGDKESAHDAFNYFDRNNDGSISCTELQVWLCAPERHAERCASCNHGSDMSSPAYMRASRGRVPGPPQ